MKKTEYYGVMLTELQGMQLSKYLSNKGIAMNTKTVEERKEIVKSFLAESCTHVVYVGAKETMESVAQAGATALNPKTMRYQTIDKNANYNVVPHESGGLLYCLMSDVDLKKRAIDNGLTF